MRRARQQLAAQGLDATLHRKLDGKQEAQLVAIACSSPPQGLARWTMKLLADRLVELEVVESIDPATVCRTPMKSLTIPPVRWSAWTRAASR